MRTKTALNGSFSAAQSAENYARPVATVPSPITSAQRGKHGRQACCPASKFLILIKTHPPHAPLRRCSDPGARTAGVWVMCSRPRTSCELPEEQSSRVAAGVRGWWVRPRMVAPGLGRRPSQWTGLAGPPLFLSPIIIPWTPDVMRTKTALNGSFSAAQSAENYARPVATVPSPITSAQRGKHGRQACCPASKFSLPAHAAPPASAGGASTRGTSIPPTEAEEIRCRKERITALTNVTGSQRSPARRARCDKSAATDGLALQCGNGNARRQSQHAPASGPGFRCGRASGSAAARDHGLTARQVEQGPGRMAPNPSCRRA